MLILLPPSRAPDFKIIHIVLFVFFTFFIVGNSYADKIYTVQKNDFLSKIVKKNYSIDHDISKEQVMVAILRANPKAFRGGNIHFLRRVDALTLPSTEAVALIPHTEALQTVNKHYTFFKRRKTGNFPPIPLKRPTQEQDKDDITSDNSEIKSESSTSTSNTIEEKIAVEPDSTATMPDDISTTAETETNTSTSSITENNLEKQQQTTTIKNEQIQELEKRKEKQNTTLDQLDSKIKTLEESITDQTTTPQSDTEETTPVESTETALQTETISGLDSLTDLSSEDTDNDTTEKTNNPKKPTYLWLLLPIFALLGLLWWKKSKTSITTDADTDTDTDTDTNVITSLEKKEQLQQRQTRELSPSSSNIKQTPANNIEGTDDTEESAADSEKTATHSNEEESAIKLDMASAYQAMGYPEEAKEMLEEIIQEGTPQQKEMAESLLAVL